MKLFVSYARVDKSYCNQIVELLDMHDVWFDRRVHAGQLWWDEILRRLDWCDGMIYLLSPDSTASMYCQKELDILLRLGKPIFPIMIRHNTPVPEAIAHIQYVDLSEGLDAVAVKELLTAIFIAEREKTPFVEAHARETIATAAVLPSVASESGLIDEAAAAMQAANYDRAVFLLKRARESGFTSRFIDLDAMLQEAETELEQQIYLREADREYTPIAALVRRERTRTIGCQAFRQFQQDYPDYDPDGLVQICGSLLVEGVEDEVADLLAVEWCEIPGGKVSISSQGRSRTFTVQDFYLSKFPVTNAQFQAFIDAPDGYHDERWWHGAAGSLEWHRANPQPLLVKFDAPNFPRGNVCWYEANAFCLWLSHRLGQPITLPTEQQWLRAAQGDDNRLYPWGNRFDPERCNSREARLRMPTPVDAYPDGASPYGVCDMAGNMWEWCRNQHPSNSPADPASEFLVPVRGGSWIGPSERVKNTFHYFLNPVYRYSSIGFRIASDEG